MWNLTVKKHRLLMIEGTNRDGDGRKSDYSVRARFDNTEEEPRNGQERGGSNISATRLSLSRRARCLELSLPIPAQIPSSHMPPRILFALQLP
jgi:hypothetical protein